MVSYEALLTDFVKDKFGSSIGQTLLQSELKLYNVKSLSQLDHKDQVLFAEKFIERKFGKFMAPDDIKAKVLQLNLHYCAVKATERISTKLNQKTTIEPFEIHLDDIYNAAAKLKGIANGSICFPVRISDSLNADVLFFIKNTDALEIANVMARASRKESTEDINNPINQALVNDFINLIVPTILESISSFLGKPFSYKGMQRSFINNPDMVEKLVLGDRKAERDVFVSEVPLVLNEKKLGLTTVLMI